MGANMRGAYGRKASSVVKRPKRIPAGTPSKERESVILAQILRYLEMRRILHWRMPVQGVMRSSRGKLSFSKSPIAGFPDIAGIHCGVFFALEVKTKVGKVSELQIGWIVDLNNSGAAAGVVRDLLDVDAILGGIEARATMKEKALNIAS